MDTKFKGVTSVSIKVKGDAAFRVMASSFGVSPSAQGYTLKFSADGTNFTAWASATAANTSAIFNNVPIGLWYKLDGNTDTVTVQYGIN